MSEKNLSNNKPIVSKIETRYRTRSKTSVVSEDVPVVDFNLPKSKGTKTKKLAKNQETTEAPPTNSSLTTDVTSNVSGISHNVSANNSNVASTGTSSRLRGAALQKAKRLAKLSNLTKNKGTNSTITSNISDILSNVSNNQTDIPIAQENDITSTPILPPIITNVENVPPAPAKKDSPFLGFNSDDLKNYVIKKPAVQPTEDIRQDNVSEASLPNGGPDDNQISEPDRDIRNDFESQYSNDVMSTRSLSMISNFGESSYTESNGASGTDHESLMSIVEETLFYHSVVWSGCEYDYIRGKAHQCCPMSMVALLYAACKIVYDWDENDLKRILDIGSALFILCQARHVGFPTNFMTPDEINNQLTIDCKLFEISANDTIYSDVMDSESLHRTFAYLHNSNVNFAILILNRLSYGLIICRLRNHTEYVLFDTHGRTPDGERFGGHTVVLFFRDVASLITCLLQEFVYVERYDLYPINFKITNICEDPLITHYQRIAGRYFYRVTVGDFSQMSDNFPLPHHQCTTMSAVAIAYCSIKSVEEWTNLDLNTILVVGHQYYAINLEYQREISTDSQFSTYLEAMQLLPDLEIDSTPFRLNIVNEHISGGFHDTVDTLRNAISRLEINKLIGGIISYKQNSYALIRCHRGGSESGYVFFDSHGRDNAGNRPGEKSAIFFFNDANDFICFFLDMYPLLDPPLPNESEVGRTLLLVPLQVVSIRINRTDDNARTDNGTNSNTENLPQGSPGWDPSDNIPLSRFVPAKDIRMDTEILGDNDAFFDILLLDTIESDKGSIHFCAATSFCAVAHESFNCIDEWIEDDLELNHENGYGFWLDAQQELVDASEQRVAENISDLPTEMEYADEMSIKFLINNGKTLSGIFANLTPALQTFFASFNQHAILKIRDEHYTIIKCKGDRGRIAFLDMHGRTEMGRKGGKFSSVIYFVDLAQMIRFLTLENDKEFPFTLYSVEIKKICALNKRYPFESVVSGRFAQNDLRFSEASRDFQCTGNSVVFLAYTFCIKENWQTVDIDRILTIGDCIYSVSYKEAIKKLPRNNRFIGAHEVIRRIAISTDGWQASEKIVICESVAEWSGNFGKFAYSKIVLFFEKHNSGVFISSNKAIALYKGSNFYALFDPHARNFSGAYDPNGYAKLFLFDGIRKLYRFLTREGYSPAVEFTLTAFDFTIDKKINKKAAVPNREFSLDDNIPLIKFVGKRGTFTSKDLPLTNGKGVSNTRNKSQKSRRPSIVRSQPITKRRDGNNSIPPCRHSGVISRRKEKINKQHRGKSVMQPEEVREKRRLWENYLHKTRRANTPRQFENADEYYKAKLIFDEANNTDDDEVVLLADKAVETLKRDEERIRQRLLNRDLIPTHFDAFRNYESVDETDEMYAEFRLGTMNKVCGYCKALYFAEERNSRGYYTGCCMNGTYSHELPERQNKNYPYIFRDLLVGTSPLRRHFLENILFYNNAFSFGSLGASDLTTLAPAGRLGPVVSVRGMIYHVAEHFHTNSAGPGLPAAQLYYLDNAAAIDERLVQSGAPLNRGLLTRIETFLRANNPFAEGFRMLGAVLREVKRRANALITNINLQIVRVRHSEEVEIRRNHGGDFSFPTSNEVAAVHTNPPPPGTNNIVIFPVDQPIEGGIPINSTDPNRDSYLYPILFPFSEQTWTWTLERDRVYEGPRARKRMTARDFYSYVLQKRDGMFSPLLNAGKLTQQYIIDSWSRVQEHQMEYQQSEEGQRKIRSETYGALRDYIDNTNLFTTDLPGKVIPMPSDFVGSRRYLKEKYLDAMAVCTKYKKPTYFVTITCNPFCRDMLDNIPKNSNPIDHPGIVSRIFNLQVAELVYDIRKRHVLGKCQALIYVIEQQKRSSGHHAHMVIFVEEEDRPANAVDIDNMVSAEIPCPITQPRLYKAVTTMMYHNKCGPQAITSCMKAQKDGGYACSKNYPKKYCLQTKHNDKSNPEYRRRYDGRTFKTSSGDVLDNRWIVPYNPYLLLKYNCHLNIEVTTSNDLLKYLFMYFHKGLDMTKIRIQVIDGEEVYNEFQHYLDCRYLSAMSSYWRLASFTIHYNDHTVYQLPVHLENYQSVTVDISDLEGCLARSGSKLLAYFQLNQDDPAARQYLYCEIPYHYTYEDKTKSWKSRVRTNNPLVARLNTVNYNNLELYSLRLLLMTVRGARSYEEIRTVNGVQYDTFHQASIAHGLHTDDNMQIRTFTELVMVEMPRRLRCLFANLLMYITPSEPLALWNMFKDRMFEDYVKRKYSPQYAEQLALRHISCILTIMGFTNSDFELPEPIFRPDQQQQADIIASEYLHNRFDPIEEEAEGRRISNLYNDDQKEISDFVVDNITSPNGQKLFHIDGPGGTGKTFLNQGIVSTLRGKKMNCTIVVHTGMGASLYKGGKTVHSTFKLPLEIDSNVGCNVSNTSDVGAQLRQTDALIWDEISMIDKYTFNAVDNLYRELKGKKDVPFGGIAVVASGDARQILPIVVNGSKADILERLVKHSNSWKYFKKCALKLNMRLTDPADFQFGSWLIDLGDGKLQDHTPNQYYDSYVKMPSDCIEPVSLVDSIYGKSFKSCDIGKFVEYAILSTHHEDVDMLNELIYDRMTEDVCTERKYYSTDRTLNADPAAPEMYDISMLHSLKPGGMPPHELKLKVNCIIMLLRNLNPYDGFCNGTRLIVKKLYNNCIVGEIISGPYKGNVILIPRIIMTAKTRSTSEPLERIQFPVQLCFAMTINKSQSQSFKSVGLFMRKPVFAHGQLYVALSRTRSRANLKAQIFNDALMGRLKPDSTDIFVPNIVYKEALN